MIRFLCPKCQQSYTVSEDFAGRATKCRKCGQRLDVPKAVTAPAKAPAAAPQGITAVPEPELVGVQRTPAAPASRLKVPLLVIGIVSALGLFAVISIVGVYLLTRGNGAVSDYLQGGRPLDKPIEHGDIRISILLIEYNQGRPIIYWLIENRSDNRIIEAVMPTYAVTDEFSNQYAAGADDFPFGKLGRYKLRPGEFAVYTGRCKEKLVEKAQHLYVDIEGTRYKVAIKPEEAVYPAVQEPFGFLFEDDRQDSQPRGRQVLFKRDDFQAWIAKWNEKAANEHGKSSRPSRGRGESQ